MRWLLSGEPPRRRLGEVLKGAPGLGHVPLWDPAPAERPDHHLPLEGGADRGGGQVLSGLDFQDVGQTQQAVDDPWEVLGGEVLIDL